MLLVSNCFELTTINRSNYVIPNSRVGFHGIFTVKLSSNCCLLWKWHDGKTELPRGGLQCLNYCLYLSVFDLHQLLGEYLILSLVNAAQISSVSHQLRLSAARSSRTPENYKSRLNSSRGRPRGQAVTHTALHTVIWPNIEILITAIWNEQRDFKDATDHTSVGLVYQIHPELYAWTLP